MARRLVTWVQRRELDRDPRAVRQSVVASRAADRVDRSGIGGEVAVGIGLRARALAQHVEGVAIELARAGAGTLQRLLDGLAKDEVIAHHAHGLTCRGAHGRDAQALGQAADDACRRLARLDDARSDAERPGRGGHQERIRLGFMMSEIALAELVLDQPVGGGGVGHAQQRFRQDHQGEALLGRERIFPQQLLDAAQTGLASADRLDQSGGARIDPGLGGRITAAAREQPAGDGAVILGIRRAEGREGGGCHEQAPARRSVISEGWSQSCRISIGIAGVAGLHFSIKIDIDRDLS